MKKIKFTKMVATGNDFVVIDCRKESCKGLREFSNLARALCERKTGVGADGMLLLESSKKADFRMRIFNADGSEAEMCGNGLRCAALQVHKSISAKAHKKKLKIETKAGIYEAVITGKGKVRIKMEEPRDFRFEVPLTINSRRIRVDYVDMGVPHAVVSVQGLDKIDVDSIGRTIRFYKEFKPRGTNVDFIEFIDDKNIKMRTYERGVEGETLACGTGAVASAIIMKLESRGGKDEINVHAKGGILKVYFKKSGEDIKDVYLEGEVRKVYQGEVNHV